MQNYYFSPFADKQTPKVLNPTGYKPIPQDISIDIPFSIQKHPQQILIDKIRESGYTRPIRLTHEEYDFLIELLNNWFCDE